jgi:hypothetical protein
MREFLLSLTASLLAGVLLLGIAGLLSFRVRWLLTMVLGRLLDIDIEYVYPTRSAAQEDIVRELSRARRVDLFTSRGNELMLETFSCLLGKRPKQRNVKFRILLPQTQPKPGTTNWVQRRESELAQIDSAFGGGLLPHQIDTVVTFLDGYLREGLVQLQRYNYPHIARIIVTDRVAFLNPNRRDAWGRDTPTIKFRRGGEMYELLAKLFEDLWSAPEPNQETPGGSLIQRQR